MPINVDERSGFARRLVATGSRLLDAVGADDAVACAGGVASGFAAGGAEARVRFGAGMPSNVFERSGLVWFGRGVTVAEGGADARGGALDARAGATDSGAGAGFDARAGATDGEARGGTDALGATEIAFGAASSGTLGEASAPQSVSMSSVDGGIDGSARGGSLDDGLGGTEDVPARAPERPSASLLTRSFWSHRPALVKGAELAGPQNRVTRAVEPFHLNAIECAGELRGAKSVPINRARRALK
jgi:hypothetical protein